MTPQFQCIVRSYTYSRTITPMLSPFYASSLTQIPSLRHGFFTRHGGVSEGYFASLNCKGRDDNPAHVHKNRRRITNFLGGRTWIGLDQKHTNNVLFIDKPLDHSPSADAMVTTTPGLVLGIITADCVPILLADKQKPIIGAVHSGWRGTFDGIIENTIALMREKGATDIIAAIGPCIHQESYEVGPEFREYFENH
ncbi:MAG: polyphenol oxidase family protein, partial [Alphaproteobacteria bacterium]|nr:polyphenol oxidase family protein [Alphaproteobacteria bacterium]